MKSKPTQTGKFTRPLPFMANFDDAAALCQKERDPFYLAAFMIQCWLGTLVLRSTADYAEARAPRNRSPQTGQAWRAFLELFGGATRKGFRYLLSCLFRFSACDQSPANSLRRALVPLSIEHHCTGDYFGPKSLQSLNRQPSRHKKPANFPVSDINALARSTIIRWCDWLDAEMHLRTHRHWHAAPACFAPDPETRQIAALGHAQRHLARFDLRAQTAWVLEFATAAQYFQDSDKWTALGKAMSDQSDRTWQYPEVDTLVIALWPLVKAYNWTYRDLLHVIRPALARPNFYPCEREQDLAVYCANVLGLRKKGRGVSAKNGTPPGVDIARRWCPALQPGGPSAAKR